MFSTSITLTVWAVAALLAFAPGATAARRACAIFLVLVGAGPLVAYGRLMAPPAAGTYDPLSLAHWGLQPVAMAALAITLWLLPRRPPLRSWHTVAAAAVVLFHAVGFVVYFTARGVFFYPLPGQPGLGTGGTIWWSMWVAAHPTVMFIPLVASSLWRARGLPATERVAAYATLPFLNPNGFSQLAWDLWNRTRCALPEGGPCLTYSQMPQVGDPLQVWPLLWYVTLAAYWVMAAYLVRQRSYTVLVIIGVALLEAVVWQYFWHAPFDVGAIGGLLGPLGLVYVVSRYGALGIERIPGRVAVALGALLFFTVFLLFAALGNLEATKIPLLDSIGLFIGVMVGGSFAYLLVRQNVAWRTARGAGGPDTWERGLGIYRSHLEREIEQGSGAAELEQRLRGLRTELGISDRDHAVLEYTIRASRSSTVQHRLDVGARFLGRYEVARVLGQGASGTTYLCHDLQLGRDVAIKQFPPVREEREREAALREARAFARLRHPNVVTIHDVEQVASQPYIVMEYMDGGPLHARIARGPLPPKDFQRLASELLAALDAIHAVGVVHRDVKPSNVLFGPDGQAKLGDFGTAHLPGFEGTFTVAGGHGLLGSVPYMAPEQARGDPATARSDLYGAAATLYEAYTGRRYLEASPGESLATLQMKAARGQEFPPGWRGPKALGTWFRKALAPDPRDRFPSAAAMRDALRHGLDPRSLAAQRPVRRHPAVPS